MGCSCSGTSTNERDGVIRTNRLSSRQQSNHNSNENERNNNTNNNQGSRSQVNVQPNQRQLQQRSRPNYVPYLNSRNDPTFNMKETKEVVGSGVKKMLGYVCEIEKEDLNKKRNDFWTSRSEGDQTTWELLRNFCEGEFNDDDLEELLRASNLVTYAGCINVIYDSKGNLYEIPNYCIHEPLVWDILKLKIEKPKEENIKFIIRLGIEDLSIETTNYCPVQSLKQHIVENFDFSKCEVEGIVNYERIRLFHYGQEMKNHDMLYMHDIDDKIVMMTVRTPQ